MRPRQTRAPSPKRSSAISTAASPATKPPPSPSRATPWPPAPIWNNQIPLPARLISARCPRHLCDMTDDKPPFQELYDLGDLGRGTTELRVFAKDDDLARIAAWADVQALEAFSATVT